MSTLIYSELDSDHGEDVELGTATALFGEHSEPRTLDDILNERHEDLNYCPTPPNNTKGFYKLEFKKLQKHILDKSYEDITPSKTDVEETDEEFNITTLNNNINTFKQQVVLAFEDLVEKETNFFIARELYDKFAQLCTKLTDGLSSYAPVKPIDDDDKKLADLVYGKLKDSYQHLNIEELKDAYSKSVIKFSLLKETILQVKEIGQKHICPLCWDNNVDTFFYPCGHTLCKSCLEKSTVPPINAACHLCRETIVDIKPLFFN